MRTDIHTTQDGYTQDVFLLQYDKNATKLSTRNPFLAPDTPLNRNLHGHHRHLQAGRLRATTAGEERKKINEDEEDKYRLIAAEEMVGVR